MPREMNLLGMLFRLGEHQVHGGEHFLEKESEAPISTDGAVRNPSVHDYDRYPPLLGNPYEIRPNLGLYEKKCGEGSMRP